MADGKTSGRADSFRNALLRPRQRQYRRELSSYANPSRDKTAVWQDDITRRSDRSNRAKRAVPRIEIAKITVTCWQLGSRKPHAALRLTRRNRWIARWNKLLTALSRSIPYRRHDDFGTVVVLNVLHSPKVSPIRRWPSPSDA